MPSPVDIVNRALSRLGCRRITSIDPPDDDKGARAAADAWPMVREEVLRAHPWNCVTTRAALAASSTAPEWGFAYAYPLPADWLRTLEVDADNYPWITEGLSILTDATAPLNIRYIRNETDTEQYDAHLVNVMVARLAMDLAPEMVEADLGTKQLLRREYETSLFTARHIDAVEQSPPDLADDEWITVRY